MLHVTILIEVEILILINIHEWMTEKVITKLEMTNKDDLI